MATAYGITPAGLLRIAAWNLRVNVLRSVLTILGMVFGTAAVIATLSSNEGSKKFIASELSKLGTNILTIQSNGAALSAQDQNVLLKYSDYFKTASLAVSLPSLFLRNGTSVGAPPALGVDVGFFEDLGLRLRSGRYYDQYEGDHATPVAIIGSALAHDLFGEANPVGKLVAVSVDKAYFPLRIVGELAPKGVNSGINFDVGIYLPVKLARVLGGSAGRAAIFATLNHDDDTQAAKRDINAIIGPRFEGALQTFDAREAIERTRSIWTNQNMVGIILAGISLITGGVGIMNVMLLSIYQRKREIGLRKAIGATDRTIASQFLLEAVIICTLGGLIGIVVGCLFGQRVAALLGNWEASLSLTAIFLAVGSSTLTGVLFGLAPALRAARLDPYDALRG